MEIIKEVFYVKGMTCKSCEKTIENQLKNEEGIKRVKAYLRDGKVEVEYDKNLIEIDEIKRKVIEEGYEITTGKVKDTVINRENLGVFLNLFVIILIGYLIVQHFSFFNFLPEINGGMTLGMLFVAGLLTSFHCVAMCGGINISQCSTGVSMGKNSFASFLYNSGRVISYTLLGGIIGAAGGIFNFSNTAKASIMIAAGLFMVLMGIKLADLFPGLRKFNPKIPFINSSKSKSTNPFVVGILNGFMPCGPLQAMQLYALGTGSFLMGALSMFVFSIGTFPLMFGLGFLSSLINKKNNRKIMIASGVIVLFLGLVMVTRGMGLTGVNVGGATGANKVVADISKGKQIVRTKLTSSGYEPISVQKGIPVRWIINAEAYAINGCNKTIVIPEYKITKELVPGENIIEFIPDKSGVFGYSCWMGMIRSSITVVDTKNSKIESSGSQSVTDTSCCPNSSTINIGKQINDEKEVYIAKVKNGVQEVEVTVDRNGYSPKIIVFQKGIKGKIKFIPKELTGCNNIVVFADYDGSLNLQRGQLETPLLNMTNDFTFTCGMDMLSADVKVVDDAAKVKKSDFLKKSKM